MTYSRIEMETDIEKILPIGRKITFHYGRDGARWFWWTTDGCLYWHTDRNGNGIFFTNLIKHETNQITGTCQFTTNGCKNPRPKIRKWMKTYYLLDSLCE